jgi:hypothetical protein
LQQQAIDLEIKKKILVPEIVQVELGYLVAMRRPTKASWNGLIRLKLYKWSW